MLMNLAEDGLVTLFCEEDLTKLDEESEKFESDLSRNIVRKVYDPQRKQHLVLKLLNEPADKQEKKSYIREFSLMW